MTVKDDTAAIEISTLRTKLYDLRSQHEKWLMLYIRDAPHWNDMTPVQQETLSQAQGCLKQIRAEMTENL